MNPNRIISDFKQRKLHIDFLELSLVQNTPGSRAISYKGKGYVQQTDDDFLAFTLYAEQTLNTDFSQAINESNTLRTGELYPKGAYYNLRGTASDGTIWTAEDVLPVCDWHAEYMNPIVRGKLSSMLGGELLPEPKSVALHFFEKSALPMTGREAKFRAAACDFQIEKDDNSFVVRARSDEPLAAHFVMRVEEALRFLLAQAVAPRAIVHPRCVELVSTTFKSSSVRLGSPISRGTAAFHVNSWGLFSTYLEFVIRKTKFGNWNPCSGYLHIAHEASANSLDAWGIGLSVAVEGLASMISIDQDKAEKDKRKAENEKLKKLRDFIIKQISSRTRLRPYADRIRGMMAGLTEVRAVDRLKWLSDHDGTRDDLVSAWKRLRNRGVHPATKGEVDVASLDFQKMIDELNAVTVLLYHIIFHLIDYRGPYTDYSTRNFPESQYPPAQPSPFQLKK
ncbi:hypothetical protein [Bradyrhizobium liaoningense]|uniref:hypothetical protein n=1 Tax=Bradyrhizobium liaoningense TaxID=43992 RepID=UPI001BAABEA5|nr:hypothetical protein [Bradyrhizobium liaoningense]MBR1170236.1 hypothetical protein [Bradyrhizobium liaoningense]